MRAALRRSHPETLSLTSPFRFAFIPLSPALSRESKPPLSSVIKSPQPDLAKLGGAHGKREKALGTRTLRGAEAAAAGFLNTAGQNFDSFLHHVDALTDSAHGSAGEARVKVPVSIHDHPLKAPGWTRRRRPSADIQKVQVRNLRPVEHCLESQ